MNGVRRVVARPFFPKPDAPNVAPSPPRMPLPGGRPPPRPDPWDATDTVPRFDPHGLLPPRPTHSYDEAWERTDSGRPLSFPLEDPGTIQEDPWDRTDTLTPVREGPEDRIWEALVDLVLHPQTVTTNPLADGDGHDVASTKEPLYDDESDVPEDRHPLVPRPPTPTEWPPKLPEGKQSPPPKEPPGPSEPKERPTPPMRDPMDGGPTPSSGPVTHGGGTSGGNSKPTPSSGTPPRPKPKEPTPKKPTPRKPKPSPPEAGPPLPKPSPEPSPKPNIPTPVVPNPAPTAVPPTPSIPLPNIPRPTDAKPPPTVPPHVVRPSPSSLPSVSPVAPPISPPTPRPPAKTNGGDEDEIDEEELRKDETKKENFVRKMVAKYFEHPGMQRKLKEAIEGVTGRHVELSEVIARCKAAAKAVRNAHIVDDIPPELAATIEPDVIRLGQTSWGDPTDPAITIFRKNVNKRDEEQMFWTMLHEGLHVVINPFLLPGQDLGKDHNKTYDKYGLRIYPW